MKRLILALALVGCGTETTSDLDIVGGQRVYKSWYGRMEVGGGFRCGGSLIEKTWYLTAKHCIPSKHRDKIKVRLGAYDVRRKDNGGKPFDLIPVQRVILHPQHDLALLKLRRPAKFKPVRYGNERLSEGHKLHAYGFGNKAWKTPGDGVLLGVVLPHRILKNPPAHIIHAGGGIGRGVCHGDSGGPLFNPKSKRLIGVAKHTASECASRRGGPDGFTRPDMGWIRRVIQ